MTAVLDAAEAASVSDERRITLAGVTHEYVGRAGRVEALAPTDLDIDPGEFVVVVGPSGCGKSTLLRIVAGFVAPSGGEVTVGDRPVVAPSPDRGVVFQQPSLYPWLTVSGNVEYGLRMRGIGKRTRREVAQRWLDLVGLGDVGDAAPYELSGGMQQRCQIARVLATEPSIVLMDEPFGALDALTRERLQGELRQLWASDHRTVLFVTHSVEEAVLLGTRVIVLSQRPGRIVLDRRLDFTHRASPADDLRGDPDFVAAVDEIRRAVHAQEDR